jgi:hypothetical protein
VNENPNMVYIENEGALFRGPARGNPVEVWSPSKGEFVPYMGSKDKGVDWGHEISEVEAKELMGEAGAEGGEESPVENNPKAASAAA